MGAGRSSYRLWCHLKQIRFLVKKKKVEPEEFWINEYPSWKSLYDSREGANQNCRHDRTALLRCRVVERIPVK